MNLTKNHIYILSAIAVIVLVYFLFFYKKKGTAPASAPATGESNYYGEKFGWKQGPQRISNAQELAMVSANVDNSVAGTMSNYQQDELTGGRPNFESGYSAAMNKAGSATNFLGY